MPYETVYVRSEWLLGSDVLRELIYPWKCWYDGCLGDLQVLAKTQLRSALAERGAPGKLYPDSVRISTMRREEICNWSMSDDRRSSVSALGDGVMREGAGP